MMTFRFLPIALTLGFSLSACETIMPSTITNSYAPQAGFTFETGNQFEDQLYSSMNSGLQNISVTLPKDTASPPLKTMKSLATIKTFGSDVKICSTGQSKFIPNAISIASTVLEEGMRANVTRKYSAILELEPSGRAIEKIIYVRNPVDMKSYTVETYGNGNCRNAKFSDAINAVL